jgi:hypothetical protein
MLNHFCTKAALGLSFLLFVRLSHAEELPAPKPKNGVTDATAKPANRFVRMVRDSKDQPTAMETAVVSFTHKDKNDGVVIDLIGAVHVGEKAYYEDLNKAFAGYDAVLYELVAPSGTKIAKGQKTSNRHVAGAMQNGMKGVLELEHQLEMIDYTQENMVHADMSPEDFSKSMADRGESFMGMMFKFMGQGMAQQSRLQAKGQNFEWDMLGALFADDRALVLKRLMAEQFEDLETSMAAFNGKDGSTIITERNKVALKKLSEELQAGKKHIAIFYGAGHLPDMEERLIADFGLQRTGERWLTAWDLTDSASSKKPASR